MKGAALQPVANRHKLVASLQDRERRILESRKTVDAQRRVFAEQGHRALDSQPDYLKGELRDGDGLPPFFLTDLFCWRSGMCMWSQGHRALDSQSDYLKGKGMVLRGSAAPDV